MAFDISKLSANWQPKVIGLITAFAAFVEFDKSIHFPQWLESLANFLMIGGLAGLGFTAKQWNVTGGTVANKQNDSEVVAANAGLASSASPESPKSKQ